MPWNNTRAQKSKLPYTWFDCNGILKAVANNSIFFRYCVSHWPFPTTKLHIFTIPSVVCQKASEIASKDIDSENITDELPYQVLKGE